jgi:hypothetical protein
MRLQLNVALPVCAQSLPHNDVLVGVVLIIISHSSFLSFLTQTSPWRVSSIQNIISNVKTHSTHHVLLLHADVTRTRLPHAAESRVRCRLLERSMHTRHMLKFGCSERCETKQGCTPSEHQNLLLETVLTLCNSLTVLQGGTRGYLLLFAMLFVSAQWLHRLTSS